MIIIIIKAELLIYAFTNAFTNLCIYLFMHRFFFMHLFIFCETIPMPAELAESFKVQFLKNMAPFVPIRDCL